MSLPTDTRQIIVTKLGTNFRECTEIQAVPLAKPEAGQILIKNKFVGINASDINFTAGRYFVDGKPPFPAGFEGIGEIIAVGDDVSLKPGQKVAYLVSGSFTEYKLIPANKAVPVPSDDPALLSVVLSGLTASISLEKEGDLKPGKTVLVTAAAGGTGQYAVQIAKLAGCHVIGTCSSSEKADFLKSIGCDRTVNYRMENLGEVLKSEYPKGVDVVYECVGKEMFEAALANLAIKGRLIVIGQISNYEAGDFSSKMSHTMSVLQKSSSIRGFFLPHYPEEHARHIVILTKYHAEGKIKVNVDNGENAPNGPFVGLEKVPDAVEYMFSRKNIGKVVVKL